MLVWRKGNIEKTLCVTIQYCVYYNGAQRYEQFLQVGCRLTVSGRALILLGLALSSKRLCVFGLKTVSEMTYNVSRGTLNSTIPYCLVQNAVKSSLTFVLISMIKLTYHSQTSLGTLSEEQTNRQPK